MKYYYTLFELLKTDEKNVDLQLFLLDRNIKYTLGADYYSHSSPYLLYMQYVIFCEECDLSAIKLKFDVTITYNRPYLNLKNKIRSLFDFH